MSWAHIVPQLIVTVGRTQWDSLWLHRKSCRIGPMALGSSLESMLKLSWTSSTRITCNGLYWDLTQHLTGPKVKHDCRCFFRMAAWSLEATRRSKDFDGAEFGIHPKLQSVVYDFCSFPCAPSLFSAGMWTGLRLYLAKLNVSNLCTRCGLLPEDRLHRLWKCESNAPLLTELRAELDQDIFRSGLDAGLAILPACLVRCALPPAECAISFQDAHRIMVYLLKVAQEATISLANARSDAHIVVKHWPVPPWPSYDR